MKSRKLMGYIVVLLLIYASVSSVLAGTVSNSDDKTTTTDSNLEINYAGGWLKIDNATIDNESVDGTAISQWNSAYANKGDRWFNNSNASKITQVWMDNWNSSGGGVGLNVTNITNSNGNEWLPTSVNLQSAIDDLTAGGTIWVPNGTILLSSTRGLDDNINLIGMGANSTILKLAPSADCDMIDIASKDNILIENICFDFDNASQSAPMGGYENCIDISGTSTNIVIRGCRFINGVGSLIDVQEGTSHVLIDTCVFDGIEINSGVYPAGVWLAGSYCTVINSFFNNTYGSGIVIEAGSGLTPSNNHTVSRNKITGETSHGIHMEWNGSTSALKSRDCLLSDNIIWDLNSTAYTVASDYGIGILVSEGSTCENNRITNIPKYGIEICGNDTKITENYIDIVQVYSGIYVTNHWYYSTTEIKDNTIERANGKGIHVSDKTQIAHIKGNIVRETGDAAIYCGAEESFINDNDLIDIPDVGIEMISPNRNLTANENYFNNIDGAYAIYCIAPSTLDHNTFYDIALHVIYLLGDENIVTGNRITYWGHAGNGDGINVHNSRNNTINDNIMKIGGAGGHSDGIELDDCFNSTLSGNNIRNTDDGIEETGTSNGNIIALNIAEVIVTGGNTINMYNILPP